MSEFRKLKSMQNNCAVHMPTKTLYCDGKPLQGKVEQWQINMILTEGKMCDKFGRNITSRTLKADLNIPIKLGDNTSLFENTSFEEFLRDLELDSKNMRKASFVYEAEIMEYLNIDLDFLDSLTIKEIKETLISKRDKK